MFDEEATSIEVDATASDQATSRRRERQSAPAAPRLGGAAAVIDERKTPPPKPGGKWFGVTEDGAAGSAPRPFDRVRELVRERPLSVLALASTVALGAGLVLGGGSEASTDVFSTRLDGVNVIRARVEEVDGEVEVQPGDECVMGVWRERRNHPTGDVWCRTQLACGGELLYGGEDSGFFECSESVGHDRETTELDGDPALDLRVRDGVLVVSDDVHGARGEFRMEASIETERSVGQ